MNNKLTINVNELKTDMNPLFKVVFIYPLELFLKLFNYIYIAILTTYFKIGVKPEIIIESVKFKTDIDIKYSKNLSDSDSDSDTDTDSNHLDKSE